MAEFNDSLLQFDSVVLDVNENPSNTTIRTCTDINEQHEFEPSRTETFCSYDLTQSDILNSPEGPINHIEMPAITNEVCTTNLDSENNDVVNNECNVPNDIMHPLTTGDDQSELSEVFNERNVNPITACDNHIEPSVNELINQLNGLSCTGNENPFANQDSDSGIHDWENNLVENTNETDFVGLNLSNGSGFMNTDFKNVEIDLQAKDEEFHDAVQFFKDPSSFTFLENAGCSSNTADSLLTRSSLYVNFDPLHAKFFSQLTKSDELHGIAEDDNEPEGASNSPQKGSVPDILNNPEVPPNSVNNSSVPDIVNKPEMPPNSPQNDNVPAIVNKHLNNVSPRESLGNILISFDSPVTSKDIHSQYTKTENAPQKLYTEEEFQQALKIQELTVQEAFLKNQHDLEISRSHKQQEMENKIEEQNRLCNVLHCLLKEFVDVVSVLSDNNKVLHEKVEVAEKENDRLKEDLKTSVEDLQSVENTFADFHKRYEQCKNMLKMYNQNEDSLKQQLENMKTQLQEKEEMYKVLQSRTQEMLDKANLEVANVKKTGDAQVAVLKAQLKKAELKISSLESDVKHVKIENSKLSGICDDLMAKVSEA